MHKQVLSGLERLAQDPALQKKFKGKVGLLCHSASVDSNYTHALTIFKNIFNERFIKIFGPQHGLVTDVQDNMVETKHTMHPFYKLPVYSLYSETRIPTDEMLEGLDHIFVDLQDVGTRVYTYIYTMTYMLEACAKKGIEVIILDRPNPINAETVEGNILEEKFASFVGRHPIAVRHALTMAEVALMHQKYWATDKTKLEIISMPGYKRQMSFEDTGLPWVLPSPNLATVEAAYTFVGTVLFEGCNISEGRGTTRSLEIFGHPKLDPWQFEKVLTKVFREYPMEGFVLRPLNFMPTFQKHAKTPCGGYQIHVTDRSKFKPWRLTQILCKELKKYLGDEFKYKTDPYEYEFDMNPMDMINGTDKLRFFYDGAKTSYKYLDEIENIGMKDYLEKRKSILIY